MKFKDQLNEPGKILYKIRATLNQVKNPEPSRMYSVGLGEITLSDEVKKELIKELKPRWNVYFHNVGKNLFAVGQYEA